MFPHDFIPTRGFGSVGGVRVDELLMTSALEDLYLSRRFCPVLLSLSVPFVETRRMCRFSRDIDEDVSTRGFDDWESDSTSSCRRLFVAVIHDEGK